MNKPLSRRLFSKAIAAMPMAAQQAAKTLAIDAAAANAAGQLAAAGVSAMAGAIPMPYGLSYALQDPALMALWKAGMAPEWLLDDIDRQIDDRGRYLSHDVAALRSVSPGAKAAINRRRQRDEVMSKLEKQSLLDAARHAFWQKKNSAPQ